MWDLAVLGNYLLVLIAFMAAPLWMAAHAMPGGDGFSSDHSRQGWLTMITILARPSIMVITWHVALLLMKEMGKFTSLFLDYAPMANADAFVGLWGSLVMWFIYIIFELVIIYRCTSLIYEVPDQMPIYYGSTNTTANENIGEGKGQSMVAGWQSSTERSVSPSSQSGAPSGAPSGAMKGNLM
jgi:conjugal transfer/type IV secretion protein DotA/TraY